MLDFALQRKGNGFARGAKELPVELNTGNIQTNLRIGKPYRFRWKAGFPTGGFSKFRASFSLIIH